MGPTVTDWIDATTGVLTLGAAVAAGVFARNAAHWTKQQAQSAQDQVDIANESLAVARSDAEVARALAEDQRREAEVASRRMAEDRVDAGMPTVLIRATPGADRVGLTQSWRHRANGRQWENVDHDEEITEADLDAVFRVTAKFDVENLSDRVARVVLIDPAGGEHDLGHEGMLVRPHARGSFTWRKVIPATLLRTEEDVHQQTTARPKLWVRDLGYNAYDVVDVVLDLRVFARDGSRLLVAPNPSSRWHESIGAPIPGRIYDRLDALTTS
jgi:hypothetical protein